MENNINIFLDAVTGSITRNTTNLVNMVRDLSTEAEKLRKENEELKKQIDNIRKKE